MIDPTTSSHYIFINSEASEQIYSQPGFLKVNLNPPIEANDGENLIVGLKGYSYTHSWHNITTRNNTCTIYFEQSWGSATYTGSLPVGLAGDEISFTPGTFQYTFTIPPGSYSSSKLAQTINSLVFRRFSATQPLAMSSQNGEMYSALTPFNLPIMVATSAALGNALKVTFDKKDPGDPNFTLTGLPTIPAAAGVPHYSTYEANMTQAGGSFSLGFNIAGPSFLSKVDGYAGAADADVYPFPGTNSWGFIENDATRPFLQVLGVVKESTPRSTLLAPFSTTAFALPMCTNMILGVDNSVANMVTIGYNSNACETVTFPYASQVEYPSFLLSSSIRAPNQYVGGPVPQTDILWRQPIMTSPGDVQQQIFDTPQFSPVADLSISSIWVQARETVTNSPIDFRGAAFTCTIEVVRIKAPEAQLTHKGLEHLTVENQFGYDPLKHLEENFNQSGKRARST